MTADKIISIARLFLYVREAQSLGQNRGQRVEAIQHWSGGQSGDSWCAEFVSMILDIAYFGKAPFVRTASSELLRMTAQSEGMITDRPTRGDLFFYTRPDGTAHHVGIVTALIPLTGIAGNTSADGTSVNGDRVAEHAISATLFAHYLG